MLRKKHPLSRSRASLLAGLFVAFGIVIIRYSLASSVIAFEPETGTLAGCAQTGSDAAASAGGLVTFRGCTDPNAISPLDLDPSGATIPDTNYAVPAGAIFMSPTGNDANAGTQAAPVKTLNKAISLAAAGGTIVLRDGTYRDWYTDGAGNYKIISKQLTFQAYPHEKPWLDGTDVIPTANWASDGAGHYVMSWSTPGFCGGGYYTYNWNAQPSDNSGPCSHYDMNSAPEYPAAADPQMAFIDGAAATEVTSLSAVTGNAFYYDWTNRQIYIATNPSGHTVELAARSNALVNGAAGVQIKGLGFKRYASNEYENISGSAVYIGGGGNALIENCVFTQMAGGALYLDPRGSTLRHNVLARNGYDSFGSNGHAASDTATDGLVMEGNYVSTNNTEHFGLHCTASCGQAGIKIAHMNGFTARWNIFENNPGAAGFWCDEKCTNGVMVYNIARGNGTGIDYEVSDTGIIASNLVYNNTEQGIQVASANTKIYNNTLINNSLISIWVYDDSRYAGNTYGSLIGPDTANIDIKNNVMYGGNVTTLKASRADSNGTNTGPNTFITGLDYNDYYRSGGPSGSLINWVDTSLSSNYTSLATFRTQHGSFEANGHDISSGTDPFFTNLAGGNYSIRSDSVAYRSATTIPDDVAAVLGITTKTGYNRGAISWPGQ